MKKLLLQLLFFLTITGIIVFIMGECINSFIQITHINILNNADFNTSIIIQRSQTPRKTRTLILGDSTADALYGKSNDSIVYSLAGSVALTAVGQYCLMAKYFEICGKNQLPKEVIVILNPTSWTLEFSGEGIQYALFAKNIANDTYLPFMEEKAKHIVHSLPFHYLLSQKWYQLSPYVPQYTAKIQDKPCLQYLYIERMYLLCTQHNIKFKVLCAPIRESKKNEFLQKCNIIRYKHLPYFDEYFQSIRTMPDSCFADLLHLKPQYIPKDYFNLYK